MMDYGFCYAYGLMINILCCFGVHHFVQLSPKRYVIYLSMRMRLAGHWPKIRNIPATL